MSNPRVISIAPGHALSVDAYSAALVGLIDYNNRELVPAHQRLRYAQRALRQASEKTRQFFSTARTLYELAHLVSVFPPANSPPLDEFARKTYEFYAEIRSVVEAYPLMTVTHPTLAEQANHAAENALQCISSGSYATHLAALVDDEDTSRASLRQEILLTLQENLTSLQEELANSSLDAAMARQAGRALDAYHGASPSSSSPSLAEQLLFISGMPGVFFGNGADAGDSFAVAMMRWSLLRTMMTGNSAQHQFEFDRRLLQLGRTLRLDAQTVEQVRGFLRQGQLNAAQELALARFQNSPAMIRLLTTLSALQFLAVLAQDGSDSSRVERALAAGNAGIATVANVLESLRGGITRQNWLSKYAIIREGILRSTNVAAALNVLASAFALALNVIDIWEGVEAGDTQQWAMGALNAVASSAILVASASQLVVVATGSEAAALVGAVAGPLGAVVGAAATVINLVLTSIEQEEQREEARQATLGDTLTGLCDMLLGQHGVLSADRERNPARRDTTAFTPQEYGRQQRTIEQNRLIPELLPIIDVLDREAGTTLRAKLERIMTTARTIRTPMLIESMDHAQDVLHRLRNLGFNPDDARTQRMFTRDFPR